MKTETTIQTNFSVDEMVQLSRSSQRLSEATVAVTASGGYEISIVSYQDFRSDDRVQEIIDDIAKYMDDNNNNDILKMYAVTFRPDMDYDRDVEYGLISRNGGEWMDRRLLWQEMIEKEKNRLMCQQEEQECPAPAC